MVDGDWQLLAASPRYIQDLWQVPSGVLFATSREAGSGALWRYDGDSWLLMRNDPFPQLPYVYGHSEDDFYFWIDRNIFHWDGADWTPLPLIDCSGSRAFVVSVTFVGSQVVLAQCYPGLYPCRLFEFDGNSWRTLTPPPQFALIQGGPAESPVTYLAEYHGGLLPSGCVPRVDGRRCRCRVATTSPISPASMDLDSSAPMAKATRRAMASSLGVWFPPG